MDFVSGISLLMVIAHAALLAFVLALGRRYKFGLWRLIATLAIAGATAAAYLLPADLILGSNVGRSFLLALALVTTISAFGSYAISDITRRKPDHRMRTAWYGLTAIWLLATASAAFVSREFIVAQAGWLANALQAIDPLSVILLVGLTIAGIMLLGFSFYSFYTALLPEVANRALFWVMNGAVLLFAGLMMISGTAALVVAGFFTLLVSMSGAVYAHMNYRLFDVRAALAMVLRTGIIVVLTAALILAVSMFARAAALGRQGEATLVLLALALSAAVLYVGGRQLVEWLFGRLFRIGESDPAQATRKFTQEVSKAVELEQLVTLATDTLTQQMRLRRSGIILINDTSGNQVELKIMQGGGFAEMKDVKGRLTKDTRLYQRLAGEQAPVTQFDLDFAPQYQDWDEKERQFFASLQMSAYAPVILEGIQIGILCCGPKLNDTPFNTSDLDLMMAMAHQTGVALRNARLVADLRHLNSSMRALNRVLEDANDQLEKLDSVKTDFITIASHELRTPLAQLRGYTDIMDALNQQGMLNQDQTTGLINNLRKATERMEELIAAMLDVSQLDVNAMDLRFAQTTAETVLRMAIDPLTDAIKQRKLTLSARGLRGLPHIQADLQRLVQAFRNIIVNAIKFTPDGGRIDIQAELKAPEMPGDPEHILVTIKDSGVGIAKENLELIFKKFFRAYDPGLHSTGTYKFMGAGPGLGLTIARGVVEGHGGKIWAESPGHDMKSPPGATFYVLLPITPPHEARRVLPFDSKNAAAATPVPSTPPPPTSPPAST
ncbi:MAG: GAF domain-containing sensor histidine kinase [Chloroflexi bacterium]|nr:GAF domain-containing sensor histidine kinase [Chloroflexota bacterium]